MEQQDKLWRKSSYSGAVGSGSCVELGQSIGAVLVRDTTNREGFTMTATAAAWRDFTERMKKDAFSLLLL
ncbi:MAG: DUF397 domain-containing protein [Streptosporangiales bacterium]|jgi:hypothetical protein|nr:DUF397 domain-containing protein [Streptosporangiales bacterium]